jgi:hypothetical protein
MASSFETIFFDVVENDVAICSKLHKKFNPALTMILLKLLSYQYSDNSLHIRAKDLAELHLHRNLMTLPNNQVLTCELNKALKHHHHHHKVIPKMDSIKLKKDKDEGHKAHTTPLLIN